MERLGELDSQKDVPDYRFIKFLVLFLKLSQDYIQDLSQLVCNAI
jgi:hypothetical protein